MSGVNSVFSGMTDGTNRTEAEDRLQNETLAIWQPPASLIGTSGLERLIARHATEPSPQQQQGESLRYVTSQADTIIRRASEAVDRRGRRSYNYDGLVRELVRRAEREPLVVATVLRDDRIAWVRPDLARDVLRGLSDEQLRRMGRRNEGRGFLQELRRHIEGEQSEARRQAAETEDRRQFARIDEAFRIGEARRNEFRPITEEQFNASFPNVPPQDKARYRELLNEAMREFGIDTPLQQAMFLAQIGQETYGLTRLGEDDQGRGRDYDEWYGRGPIQLTGIDNYKAASKYFGLPLLDNKELAADPQHGFRIAAWFWTVNRNVNGDIRGSRPDPTLSDFRSVTRKVNGGFNGWGDRLRYYRTTLNALQIEGREAVYPELERQIAVWDQQEAQRRRNRRR